MVIMKVLSDTEGGKEHEEGLLDLVLMCREESTGEVKVTATKK